MTWLMRNVKDAVGKNVVLYRSAGASCLKLNQANASVGNLTRGKMFNRRYYSCRNGKSLVRRFPRPTNCSVPSSKDAHFLF